MSCPESGHMDQQHTIYVEWLRVLEMPMSNMASISGTLLLACLLRRKLGQLLSIPQVFYIAVVLFRDLSPCFFCFFSLLAALCKGVFQQPVRAECFFMC